MSDTRASLEDLLAQVTRELGVHVVPNAPTTGQPPLPPALSDFYALSDGLALPFLEIRPASQVTATGVPGWLEFGSDYYSSFCLCSVSPGLSHPLDLWDHDAGIPPEGAFASVLDLVRAAYDGLFEVMNLPCSLLILAVPDAASRAEVVTALKSLCGATSADLLDGLRHLPLSLPVHNRADAILAVRALHRSGVSCHMQGCCPNTIGVQQPAGTRGMRPR